jgi:hypothetical protein
MQNNSILRFFFLPPLVISISLLFLSFNPAHPYYVSVSEIKIDTEKGFVNVSCRMFTEDLQNAIYKLYQEKIDLMQNNESNKKLLAQYINERLKIVVGDKAVVLKFIGFEIEEEATWCYLENTSLLKGGKVQILNTLLYDFLPEQSNLIHCYYNNLDRKSYKLNNPDKLAVFEFN